MSSLLTFSEEFFSVISLYFHCLLEKIVLSSEVFHNNHLNEFQKKLEVFIINSFLDTDNSGI